MMTDEAHAAELSRARGDAGRADDLEALLEKATPGDWAAKTHPESRRADAIYGPAAGKVAYLQPMFGRPHVPPEQIEANAALIVFLRNNAKHFIAALRKAERHDEG